MLYGEAFNEYMSIGLREPTCKTKERYEIMMPMSDGVELHTVFFIPDIEGPYTLIFSRNPYEEDRYMLEYQGKVFSERGYAFAHQYCRGIGKSGGEWDPFANERQDGIDALEWLQKQDFIKDIGLYGLSYIAFCNWMVLDCLPEKVKTAYLIHFGANRYGQMYTNGLFRHDIYTPWAMYNNGQGKKFAYEDSLKAGVYKPHIDAAKEVWGVDLPWYSEWISHPESGDPYWTSSFWETLKHIPEKVDVPLCVQCGWYDHHFDGMMYGYSVLNDAAKKVSRLVIGPWEHGKEACIEAYDTGSAFEAGVHGYQDSVLWMDRIFKNADVASEKVLTYEIGGQWVSGDVWPPVGDYLPLYFTSDGAITKETSEEKVLGYKYNPDQYIMTHGAECMLYSATEKGSLLQDNIGTRDDELIFSTAPFEKGIKIAGKMKVSLKVSSSAEDTEFVVKVFEKKADGSMYNIRTGATSLVYRNNSATALDYVPGTPVICDIEFWDILWCIEPGASLVVQITSSSFPEYVIHTNTRGDGWCYAKDKIIAEQSVFVGGPDSTVLYLPVQQ